MSKSQKVKDSYMQINIYENFFQTKVEICISTYSNADVICYSATWRTELNERNSVCVIAYRS